MCVENSKTNQMSQGVESDFDAEQLMSIQLVRRDTRACQPYLWPLDYL